MKRPKPDKEFDLIGGHISLKELFDTLNAYNAVVWVNEPMDFIEAMHDYYLQLFYRTVPGCMSRWNADGSFEFIIAQGRRVRCETDPELARNELHAQSGAGIVIRVFNISWRMPYSELVY